MNKSFFILVLMSCLSIAFQGNVQLCVHQQKHAGDPFDFTPSSSTLWEIGAKVTGNDLLEPFMRIAFSSGELENIPDVPEAFDINARQWRIRCGTDAFPWDQGFFFLRASAGASYYMMDYADPDTIGATVYNIRKTDHRWLSSLSGGIGSHVPLGEIALVKAVDFVLEVECVNLEKMFFSGGIEVSL